jgi:hypothetical protein
MCVGGERIPVTVDTVYVIRWETGGPASVLLAGEGFVHVIMREAVSCSVYACQQLSHQQLTLIKA